MEENGSNPYNKIFSMRINYSDKNTRVSDSRDNHYMEKCTNYNV